MTAANRSMGLLLEGGGSRTWIGLTDGDYVVATASGPSTNPRSVGQPLAERTVTDLISQVLDQRVATLEYLTAAHGAASTTAAASQFAELLVRACAKAGAPTASVRLTNDITAVLLASTEEQVCAVIAGTGTGYAARNGQVFARASGLEWLLSDEGGGHDLAIAGLRAAVRALDGRGPGTVLTDAAHAWCTSAAATAGMPVTDRLFDAVYRARSKPRVATFAAEVLTAATAGDTVALGLVENAAGELATGVRAVCRKAGLKIASSITLVLAGSLLTGTAILAEQLLARLAPGMTAPAIRYHLDRDHESAVLTLHQLWRSAPHVLAAAAAAIPTVTMPALI